MWSFILFFWPFSAELLKPHSLSLPNPKVGLESFCKLSGNLVFMKTLHKLKPRKDPVRRQVPKSSMCVHETVIKVSCGTFGFFNFGHGD